MVEMADNELARCATETQCNMDIDASNVLFGRSNHFSSGTALARVRIRENHIRGFLTSSTAKSQKLAEMAENELA